MVIRSGVMGIYQITKYQLSVGTRGSYRHTRTTHVCGLSRHVGTYSTPYMALLTFYPFSLCYITVIYREHVHLFNYTPYYSTIVG